MLDTYKSKYTCTVQEMEDEYNVTLDFTEVPYHHETIKREIEQAIRDYFYFRELGYESIGRFNFAFNRKMRLIMPVFNKLYALDDALGEYLTLFENADYRVIQDDTRNQQNRFDRNVKGTENRVGKETGESIQDSQRDVDVNDVMHGDTMTNVDGNSKTVNSGEDVKKGEISDVGFISRNTDDERFRVDSNLPQQMITREEIGLNIWASNASKDHDKQGVAEDNQKHVDSTENVTHGLIVDGNTQSESIGVQDERRDSTTKDVLANKLNNIVDLVNDTTYANQINDVGVADSIGKMIRHVKGNIGNRYMVELLPLVRQAILNIPAMIIQEIEPLFMGVW